MKKGVLKNYLILSIILEVILTLLISLEFIRGFIFGISIKLIPGIVWPIVSFFILIYFLAKKYKYTSFIVPILFIIQTITMIFMGFDLTSFIILIIFALFIIGVACYFLWHEE